MQSLPCQGCKGMCCGPVPITKQELKAIQKKLKSMPAKLRTDLENQQRFYGTCIFYDLENDRCGIYSARPKVCRVFGHHKNMPCFRNPEAATESPWHPEEEPIGMLTTDFTWKNFK
jgi:uncharacterized protein